MHELGSRDLSSEAMGGIARITKKRTEFSSSKAAKGVVGNVFGMAVGVGAAMQRGLSNNQ